GNPNKPSSKKTRAEKEEEKRRKREREERRKGEEDESEEEEEKGGPGRKTGHEPAWREKPDPEEEIDVTQDLCEDTRGYKCSPRGL
ncbi:hypothetical protein AKJ39_04725, partial [candidate division MSBL1 archaeon SCGC-AAA259J03]